MRWLAIGLNIAQLGAVAYIFFRWGAGSSEKPIVWLMVVCAVVNLAVRVPLSSRPNLLVLYMQRRRLEEQAKIDSLNAMNK